MCSINIGGFMSLVFEFQEIIISNNKLVIDRKGTKVWGTSGKYSELNINKIIGFVLPLDIYALNRVDIVILENEEMGIFNKYREKKYRLYIKKDEIKLFNDLMQEICKNNGVENITEKDFSHITFKTKKINLFVKSDKKAEVIKKYLMSEMKGSIRASIIISVIASFLILLPSLFDKKTTMLMILAIWLLSLYGVWASFWGIKFIFVKVFHNKLLRSIYNVGNFFFGLGFILFAAIGCYFGFLGGAIYQFNVFYKRLKSDFSELAID
jgi:hypothetical protein